MLRTRIVLVHPGQRAPPPREDIGRSRPADVFTLPPLTLVGLTITDVEDLDWASCQSVGKAAWFLGQANTVPCLRHRAITERRHKASNSTRPSQGTEAKRAENDRFRWASDRELLINADPGETGREHPS